jgi:hypothetical protein
LGARNEIPDRSGQEQQLFHRLRFAKPLGFGSVKINVDEVCLLYPSKRYRSLQENGWQPVTRDIWHEQCVVPFKQAMIACYGIANQSFEELDNIQDLRALLSEPQCEHIHYPRSLYCKAPDRDVTKPDPEGKLYEWFVGNKKAGIPLKRAFEEDKEENWLPLMTSKGEFECPQ